MFLLVPANPGCPGQTAVKWLVVFVVFTLFSSQKFFFAFSACFDAVGWAAVRASGL